jgi:aspartyl protease family protein
VLKPVLTLALPALLLGIGLAQTTPEIRANAFAAVLAQLGVPGPDLRAVPTAVGQRPPVAVPAALAGTVTIDADRFGQYQTTMEIAGRTIPAIVDTGASYVALSYEDAAGVGIHPANQAFTALMHTANGVARAAPVLIQRIRVGNVEAYDIPAVVSEPGALTMHNLLGMSFLRKLSGFQATDGRLVLRQ